MEELKVIWVVRRPGGEPPSLLFFEYLSLHCHAAVVADVEKLVGIS